MLEVTIMQEKFCGESLDSLATALDGFCARSNLRQVTYYIDVQAWRVSILHGDVVVWNVPIIERS